MPQKSEKIEGVKVRCIYRSYPKSTVIYTSGYIIILPSFETMNGVIWSKTQKTFVPISSVPMYAMMQKERLRQSRALELHNFQLQNLTLASFQEQYLVHFYDNNMKITGFCGEIWNLLSESLNFTLQLVKANLDDQGMSQKDAFKNGLLPIIFRNETIAIAKLQSFSPELTVTEFSIPFWTNRLQLYIHRETIYDNIWMVNIFSWKIWCVILSMCLILSLCTFLTQSILIQNKDKRARKNISLSEHLFYNFGNLCNQGYIPQDLDGKSRILEVSLGLFCSIIYMSFGAVLFIHLSKSVFVPPFDSFTTLVTNTKYNVVGLKGSTAEAIFKINEDPFLQAKKMERLIIASTFEDMHKMACFSKKEKYVIFQTEAMYKVIGNIMCHLTNVGEPYAKTWVTSGIVKNFKYKRSIDLGILKLMEIGLLNVLKKRWLENDFKYYYAEDETPKPIELHQVSLIIAVMCCGIIIALIIFIIEKIVFAYTSKQLYFSL